ncbi:cytochrome P450 2K6-like [Podarcis lilfordi]|uniref:Cytochrome P450 2K6-like n=1 Tax=Podarcis lilfordi TaxID=74358 RepID=A0AA35P2C5_9SAUR|nr:cytochrome P450 2K6-like [Podarcis lilfordi]
MDWTEQIPALFLLILTIIFILKWGSFWNRSSKNLPPGPTPLPLVGNLHMMDLKRPYRTMLKLSKEHGPIFRTQMGFQKMVVLTGYETVKEALVNQADAFAERPAIPIFEEYTRGFGEAFPSV